MTVLEKAPLDAGSRLLRYRIQHKLSQSDVIRKLNPYIYAGTYRTWESCKRIPSPPYWNMLISVLGDELTATVNERQYHAILAVRRKGNRVKESGSRWKLTGCKVSGQHATNVVCYAVTPGIPGK